MGCKISAASYVSIVLAKIFFVGNYACAIKKTSL
jgi:hypothetical protein